MGVCPGEWDQELLLLSSGGAGSRLKDALGRGPVDKAVGDFVHHRGLVDLAASRQRGQLETLEQGCGAGGAAEVSSDAASGSTLHGFKGVNQGLLVWIPDWRGILQDRSDEAFIAVGLDRSRASIKVA